MKTILSLLLLVFLTKVSYTQTILFNQGFENRGLSPTENWGYSGGNRTTETSKEGIHSLRIGRFGLSNEVIFNTVDISQYPNTILQISHSVRIDSMFESGLDEFEGIAFQVSLNSGSWATIHKVSGLDNYHYTFNDTIAGAVSSNSSCRLYKTPNPLNYSIPNGTSTISVRVISIKSSNCRGFNYDANNGIATNYDRIDEGFYIDNVRVVTNEQASTFPVEMVKFNSTIQDNKIQLDWITATEINTNRFVIERSRDGLHFDEIGHIIANNIESMYSYYQYVDENPLDSNNYYRLKIVDSDESFEYSDLIHNFLQKKLNINIYPNPILSGQILNIETEEKIEKLIITDLSGRVLSTNNQIPDNTSPGIYLVNLQIGNTSLTNKIQVK